MIYEFPNKNKRGNTMKKLLLITGALLMATTHSTFAAQQDQNASTQKVNKHRMTFAQLDTNADGFLSKDEVRGRLLANFGKLDSEGNGTLSPEEFDAAANLGRQGRPSFAQLDVNKDGFLSKDEVRGRLLANFDKVDSDASGTLSGDEFNARIKMDRHGHKGDRPTFEQLDSNGDGTLSADEFNARVKMGKQGKKGDRGHHPSFEQLDLNHDGFLAKDEVRSRLLANFDKVDSDASGTLSADEFNARVKMGKQGKKGDRGHHPSFEQLDLNHDGFLAKDEVRGRLLA
ncbi:MAG: Ca2+-binding EF-hand superfamily protein, partial [Psychromonas sp.]